MCTNYFVFNGIDEFKIVAWNQKYLRFTLKQGDTVTVNGKIDSKRKQILQKKITISKEEFIPTNFNAQQLIPTYSKITKLPNIAIQNLILNSLTFIDDEEYKKHLMQIHCPQNHADLIESKQYLKYREFYNYYIKLNTYKDKKIEKNVQFNKHIDDDELNVFYIIYHFL